jgi:hypothetical protein
MWGGNCWLRGHCGVICVSAVRQGPFSKSARRGAPPVISCQSSKTNPRYTSSLKWPTRRIILLGSTPEIYTHEWASFTTKEFPENRRAKSGDEVRNVMKDVKDKRPVVDQIWFHEDYLNLFAGAGLDLVSHHAPLGREDEPYEWLTETSIAPWVIYVLRKKN